MKPVRRLLSCLLLLLFIVQSSGVEGQNCCQKITKASADQLSANDLSLFLKNNVPDLMREEQIPGAAVVVVQNGKILAIEGFGLADLERKKSVDPHTTIFPIGSISKVFTATALMQLADQKKIDLHRDVNHYLKKLQAPKTYPEPITAASLLNHTSGLDEIRPGTQAESEKEIMPLSSFLKERLVRVHPPGLITSYSTYGITLAGLLVEEMSGTSYENYLSQNIWKPLAMNRTHISTPPQLSADVAIGYAVEEGKPVVVPYEWYHTIPASSIRSTAEDLANFLIAHLQCGRPEDRRIMSAESICEMHKQQSTTHPEMPGWTYGFQEDDKNGLHILEHGGDIAGFGSLLVLLPDQGVGLFVAHHVEGANLRFELKNRFLDRFFPDKREVHVPTPVPQKSDELKRFSGLYRGNIFCHTCTTGFPVAEVEVVANNDGTISALDERWVQTSPLLFVRMDGKRKIGFQADKSGKILQLSAGSWKVLEKVR